MEPPIRHLTPEHADYPARLLATNKPAAKPPLRLSVRGSLALARDQKIIAVVGSRIAHRETLALAEALGAALSGAGMVVISGGAYGIDAAAHRGAMAAGGRTWAVCGTGSDHVFPTDHASLYEDIARSGGAILWPFAAEQDRNSHTFKLRNGVLATLADAVVVVQAAKISGALNAASWADRLRRPLYVVPIAPWSDPKGYEGSLSLLDRGANAFTSVGAFLTLLGAAPRPKTAQIALPLDLGEEASALFEAASFAPQHVDELAASAGLNAKAAATALLTLALENVLVEGPGGFFRRSGP